jgi:hypothetical protein
MVSSENPRGVNGKRQHIYIGEMTGILYQKEHKSEL